MTGRLHMGGIPRDLPRCTRLVPVMCQALAENTQRLFQLRVIAEGCLATQPGGVQQMGIQLFEQVLATGEELRCLR